MSAEHPVLSAENIVGGYGKRQVLDGVSVSVSSGQIVAIIGPNGCGKTTTLKAIAGVAAMWSGKLLLDGSVLNHLSTAERFKRGLTFCPQGNLVFPELSVRENIDLGGLTRNRTEIRESRERIVELFPHLKRRFDNPAGVLSGGEQQMVSLARALVSRPKILMLDEPSLGLSPKLLADLFEKLDEIRKNMGIGILIVEQKVDHILQLADDVVAMKMGKALYVGSASDLRGNSAKLKELFL